MSVQRLHFRGHTFSRSLPVTTTVEGVLQHVCTAWQLPAGSLRLQHGARQLELDETLQQVAARAAADTTPAARDTPLLFQVSSRIRGGVGTPGDSTGSGATGALGGEWWGLACPVPAALHSHAAIGGRSWPAWLGDIEAADGDASCPFMLWCSCSKCCRRTPTETRGELHAQPCNPAVLYPISHP